MEIALITSAWRFLVAVSGLAIFIGVEARYQFKNPLESKLRHYFRNLLLGLSNGLILHLTVGGLIVAYYDTLEKNGIGLMNFFHLGTWTNIALSLVFLDLITYAWHRAYHEVPFLWRLHRLHHSDLDLDVTSASRFHISEIALSSGLKMIVGLVWGPSAIALAIHEAMLGLAAQFHHSNMRLTEPWESRLRKIIVTPHMHHIHHSNIITETNSNYSNFLSIWDRLLGTYIHFDDQERIVYGLEEYAKLSDVSFKKLMLMPFGSPCGENRDKASSDLAKDAFK